MERIHNPSSASSRCRTAPPIGNVTRNCVRSRCTDGETRAVDAICGLGERLGGDEGSGIHSNGHPRGQNQRKKPEAWRPREGVVARELWCRALVEKPRYCAGCKGDHDHQKAHNPKWQSFTPQTRLRNMHLLSTRFEREEWRGALPCALDSTKPEGFKWIKKTKEGKPLTPHTMTKEDYKLYLPLMFEGARGGHEPHRHLATCCAEQMMARGRKKILAAVPHLISPIRLALQSMQPEIAGHMLNMLQALVKSHPRVGVAIVPHFKKILPGLRVYISFKKRVMLPPPHCVPATGSSTGKGIPPEAGSRTCHVCGKPLDKMLSVKMERKRREAVRDKNAALPLGPEPEFPRTRLGSGRFARPYILSDLVSETLHILAEHGGARALSEVKKFIPTFDVVRL